ncbi:MAG: hypothetical protein HOP31_07065 [Ignavibacteria bacterium]|nr:hypothetical protein [Ignavibacteria bacterium]
MEQNKNRDKWVEDVLSSTENIKRAEASTYIYPKILHRLKSGDSTYNIIPFKRAAFGIVTVVLLAVLNIFIVFTSQNDPGSKVIQNTESSLNSSGDQLIPSQVNPYLEILNN